jgi:hypothetical protein
MGKKQYAHRLAWSDVNGEIPTGLFVCHACDNRRCVNVSHLWLGTAAENAQDRDDKGRRGTPNPRRGEAHPHATLTEKIVHAIRLAEGTQRQISDRFGVAQMTVCDIRRRIAWRHV